MEMLHGVFVIDLGFMKAMGRCDERWEGRILT